MKRFLAIVLSSLAMSLVMPLATLADTITYPGHPLDVGGNLIPDKSSENTVTVTGGTITGSTYGGYGKNGVINENGGNAYNNTLTFTAGTAYDSVYGGSGGKGASSGTIGSGGHANYNRVIISNGVFGSHVHGGAGGTGGSAGSGGDGGNANHNTVFIANGTFGGAIYGGLAGHGEGNGDGGDASYNAVTIAGGSIASDIYGGNAGNESGSGISGKAHHNTVTILGGKIDGSIYGGHAKTAGYANYNTVTLSGSPIFNAIQTDIYGGFSTDPNQAFLGNTLNIWNYQGSSVKDIKQFENYHFILPSSLQSGGTLLTASSVKFGDNTTQKSTITGLSFQGGGKIPTVGDSFTLIAGALTGNLTNEASDGQPFLMSGQKGVSLLYDFEVTKTPTALMASILSTRLNPQTKALSEGRAASMAFLTQGSELIAQQGIRSALASTEENPLSAFAVINGGKSRYKTGSHIDIDGLSLLLGIAGNKPTDLGNLLLGVFLESGWGSYDSHNSFSGYATIKGDGNTTYQGGGFLGRFDFTPLGQGNVYTEASLRAGRTKTEFSTGDLRDASGKKADYDSSSAYYGGHLGLGYVWDIARNKGEINVESSAERLTNAWFLDMYAKYFWTHQNSDSVSISDDPVHFKAADSHRLRGGAQLNHTLFTQNGVELNPYLGLAYEYEFDGKIKASAYGLPFDTPELKGGTGIGEIGLTLKPAPTSPVSLDLSAQGYTGTREGMSGNVKFTLDF